MDIKIPHKTKHAKWVGLLIAFLIPGSAHYLSGHRKTGILLLAGLWAIPMVGIGTATIPHLAGLYLGLTLFFLVNPVCYLAVLFKSYRPIHRLSPRGWIGFVIVLIALNLLKIPLIGMLPVKTYSVPTGAMEPTLHGKKAVRGGDPTHWGETLFQGKSYHAFTAEASGPVQGARFQDNAILLQVGDTPHRLPGEVFSSFKPEAYYEKTETIWSGTIQSGDRILADRIRYLFSQPQRGDIITFETKDIVFQGVNPNTTFVKRIVGLPGETIQIKNARLWVDGREISEPPIFKTLEYRNDGKLASPEESIVLGPDEYLTFGDNTAPNRSLDGRFFGPIYRDRIVAKVQTIYWPFQRMGVVE